MLVNAVEGRRRPSVSLARLHAPLPLSQVLLPLLGLPPRLHQASRGSSDTSLYRMYRLSWVPRAAYHCGTKGAILRKGGKR